MKIDGTGIMPKPPSPMETVKEGHSESKDVDTKKESQSGTTRDSHCHGGYEVHL